MGRGERLLAVLVRRLPAARRDLGEALLAEASVVPAGRRRVFWLIGGFWFVAREGAMRMVWYAVALGASTAILIGVDRIGTSDDSGQVSLLVLLVFAAALGFAAPRRAWLAGTVLGAAIAAANIVYRTLGPAPAHEMKPPGVAGAATLLVLIVPALVAAYLGAGAAWLLRRPR